MTTVAETATLAHGYTMAEIDALSFKAARRSRSTVMAFEERQEVAWMAIVEMLYSGTERPTRFTLANCGSDAVDAESRRVLHAHGIRAGEPGVGEHDQRPRFQQYWLPITTPTSDFTERIVEREALPQVLAKLTPTEYETIVTLAVHGSQKAAAEALGLNPNAYTQRLWRARGRLWCLWFEHETPPPKTRASATTCRYGHSKADYGFTDARGSLHCRRCTRNRTNRDYAKNREKYLNLDLAERA